MQHTFKHFLKESIIDIPRNTVDPTVFSIHPGGHPILQLGIKQQILKDINKINVKFPVTKFYIVGSILTKHYNRDSDIDVNVEIDVDRLNNDGHQEAIMRLIKKINGKMAIGTTHPINYYITREEYDLDKTDAAYDVLNNKWIKEDKTGEKNIDINQYVDTFKKTLDDVDVATGELRRDILDLEAYKVLPSNQISRIKDMMEAKLEEIEDDIIALSLIRKNTASLRRAAFKRNMTPDEIIKYTSSNWLPENITYKLLSKYQYSNFIKQLEKFLDKRGDLKPKDIDDIKNIGKQTWM